MYSRCEYITVCVWNICRFIWFHDAKTTCSKDALQRVTVAVPRLVTDGEVRSDQVRTDLPCSLRVSDCDEIVGIGLTTVCHKHFTPLLLFLFFIAPLPHVPRRLPGRAGLAVGLMVNYGVGEQFDFDAETFFYVVLPPIIFHQVCAMAPLTGSLKKRLGRVLAEERPEFSRHWW